MRELLVSKIHRAKITEANLEYIGSITIDQALMEKVDLWPYQKVSVVCLDSGARLETYVIEGKRDSGTICMNGAAAHLMKKGETIIIMGYKFSEKPFDPKCILVNEENKFIKYL
jgi:aspartate 1-decarboxylase